MAFSGLNTNLTLGAAIAEQAERQGDKIACTFLCADLPPQQLTYRQLHQQALRYAAYLRANAIGAGDMILLAGQHDLVLLVAFVGALYAGAVPAIFPYLARYSNTEIYLRRLSERAMAHQLRAVLISSPSQPGLADHLAGMSTLILALDSFRADAATSAEQWCNQEQAAFAIDARPATASAYLQFSSGTTAEAKGVVVSHGAALRYIAALAQTINVQNDDVVVGWLPFHHDMGLVCYVFFPLLAGVHVVTMPPDLWVRRPHRLLRIIQAYRGTLAMLPTFALAHTLRIVQDEELVGLDLSTLRWILIGAEIIQPQLVQEFQRRFLSYGLADHVICAGYGMAEAVLAPILGPLRQGVPCDLISKRGLVNESYAQPLASSDPDVIAIAACGVPIADTSVTIVDDAGQRLPDRQVGEIVICCPFLFDGYLQRRDLTTNALRDGSFYTGDLGYWANGQLFVVGRKQDLIITAGKNVYPESIERLALAELGETGGRAAAFGVQNEELGTELLVLVCEVRGQVDKRRHAQYIQQIRWRTQQELDVTLADIQLVRRGWLAVTTSGKVARAATRQKYLDAGFQPQPITHLPSDLRQQTPLEIEATLALFFSDVLGGARIDPAANLFEMGISSLLLAQSITQIEQVCGCAIPVEQFVQQPTIARLAQFLATAQPTSAKSMRLPELPLLRQHYSKNRGMNYFLNDGLRLGSLALPYALGVRLQRAWLAQRWVQRVFRGPLTVVKYMASQVGEYNPQEAILRSLMCNIWSYWRIHQLRKPATFAQWCTVQSAGTEWPPKSAEQGIIYALAHTPDSCAFPVALQQHGITPTIIGWGRTNGLAPQQVQTMQVYQAQQTLRQKGVVVIFADATAGSGGIEVDFWGGRRAFRPGMAALAEASGAAIVPVFSAFATTGTVLFELAEPLVAQGSTVRSRIDSLLYSYVELLRSRWAQLYSNLWWRFLR